MRQRSLRRLGALPVVGALVLTLAACGGQGHAASPETGSADAAQTRVFSADNGEIEIPADPQRVVATGYAVAPLIEIGANLVGISAWSRGLPMMSEEDVATYESLPKVAGESAAETDYEAIAEADPDLIIIGVPTPALVDLDLDRLASIAPTLTIGPTVPDAWRELTRRQADAVNRLDAFEESKAAYEARAGEIRERYADALADLQFGHLGAYGDVAAGEFHREFAGSWGTNIATDIGVTYYGEVAEKAGGAQDVTEYPSIEQLPESFADADVITYTVEADGTVPEAVQYVMDSPLWQNLPAVQAGKVFPLRFTEAVTFTQAMLTLEHLDSVLAPLLP